MIRLALVVFAIVVFVMLAFQVVIQSQQTQWAEGAIAAFLTSTIVDDTVAYVTRAPRQP
jgi:hypothetical protein